MTEQQKKDYTIATLLSFCMDNICEMEPTEANNKILLPIMKVMVDIIKKVLKLELEYDSSKNLQIVGHTKEKEEEVFNYIFSEIMDLTETERDKTLNDIFSQIINKHGTSH